MRQFCKRIGFTALWVAFGASLCASMGCGCPQRQPIFQRPGLIAPRSPA